MSTENDKLARKVMSNDEFRLMANAFEREFPLDEVLATFRAKHNMFRRLELYTFIERRRTRIALERIADKKK